MIKVYDNPLREKYAGQAMAALVESNWSANPWEIARRAFEIADAMIDVKNEDQVLTNAQRDYETFSQS